MLIEKNANVSFCQAAEKEQEQLKASNFLIQWTLAFSNYQNHCRPQDLIFCDYWYFFTFDRFSL